MDQCPGGGESPKRLAAGGACMTTVACADGTAWCVGARASPTTGGGGRQSRGRGAGGDGAERGGRVAGVGPTGQGYDWGGRRGHDGQGGRRGYNGEMNPKGGASDRSSITWVILEICGQNTY